MSEPETRLYVGLSNLRGAVARYAQHFDLLEVSGERGKHPRRAGLAAWREEVRPEFVFSVVVPPRLASLEAAGAERDDLLAHAREVADTLRAGFWVLRTPPTVTPSARSVRGLTALTKELESGDRRVAWEARGPWSDENLVDTAGTLGVHIVRDLARDQLLDDDSLVYTRLRALGEGARVGTSTAERVAERAAGAEELYVVVEGDGARGLRRVLREVFAAGASDSALDDDEEEEDDEADDADEGEGADDDGEDPESGDLEDDDEEP